MKYFHPIYLALFICIALIACSGSTQQDVDEEILADKPTADQLYHDQGTIGQDMSPDTRDGDGETTEAGRMAEPRLIPDLSHVLSREAIAPPTGFVSANIYTGTLPCANCSGIETELTMLTNPATGHRRYILKQTYLSTREGDQTYWESGPWDVQRFNDGRRVYRLSHGDEAHRRSFEIATDRVIRLLDQGGESIESRQNYSLYRLPTP
jgi:hypothetical protein